MKLKILLTFGGLLLCSFLFAQDMEKYSAFVKEAWSLYESKDFNQSAEKYKAAFATIEGKAYPNDRYNAACSYALSSQADDAFFHLGRLADSPKVKYKNYAHITTDPDLNSLHEDERWKKLISTVKANKEEAEKYLDKELVAELDVIHEEDQKYRKQIRAIQKEHGRDSEEMKQLWETIHEKDSINLIKVSKILDERGWLGSEVVGQQGNSTLFLVIQHSGLEVQEKYLPMMRQAVKDGKARGSSLALLEDRVLLRQGKRQIYGSQIHTDQETGEMYVAPLIEPEKVDERRASVGLQSLADYVKYFDMTWDLEKHKATVAKVEAAKKMKEEKAKGK